MNTKINNVFIDVGAHRGEALEEALRPVYILDKFLVVEPSSTAFQKLNKFRDSRLTLFKFAVSNLNSKVTLYSAGSVGGAIYADKDRHWPETEIVPAVKFSEFLENNTKASDSLYIKINVEGSELDLLRELLLVKDRKILSILLSIDLVKVPSLQKYETEFYNMLSNYLYPIRVRSEKKVNVAVRNWLVSVDLIKSPSIQIYFADLVRGFLPFDRNILRLIKPLVPGRIWLKVALKFGPNRAKKVVL